MKRIVVGFVSVGILLGSTVAWADTTLRSVTPQNINDTAFRVTGRASRNRTVAFVIRRDVRHVSGPSRAGYLFNPAVDGKTIGRPVKLEERGNIWTFRFSIPESQVEGSVFTLWGAGKPTTPDQGVTYKFKLADFRKPERP
jgi:hypothetical protein